MHLSISYRRIFSTAVIISLLPSPFGCARSKSFAKRLIKGEPTSTVDLSYDATVTVPPAPTNAAALDLPITILRRPATSGIPLTEGANVRELGQLALVDATGKAAPAQFRVLARWRGASADASRPIKWLLMDTDAPAGNYHLTLGPPVAATAPIQSSSGASFTVDSKRIKLTASAKGNNLITSLIIDGKEKLSAPFNVRLDLPRASLLVTEAAQGSSTLKLADPGALTVGSQIRFEHLGELPFETTAGANRVAARERDQMYEPGRTYRLEEGTPRQEDIFVIRRDDGGWIYTQSPVTRTHPPRSRIRDLGSESETATIKSIDGQTVTLDHGLKVKHNLNEMVSSTGEAIVLSAVTEETRLEETGPMRVVLRQDGVFQNAARNTSAAKPLRFTIRYHLYASEGYVRVQLRILNTGPFGFGGERNGTPPFAQHALIKSLAAVFPLANASAIKPQRLEARNEDGPGVGSVTAAQLFEICAPEFSENFPKALSLDSTQARYEILPDGLGEVSGQYVFEGARAKTTEFFVGVETKNAAAISSLPAVSLDPEYVASSKAVRPMMVEKRNWTRVLAEDRTLGVAAMRMERWLAGAYAVEADEGIQGRPPQSIFEVRRQSREGTLEKGNGHFGWKNFGDLTWADGYSNLHYDIPYIVLREFLRTGDKRAFQLGSEMARYRSDWGQHHAVDYLDTSRTFNFKGFAFYEKGDHGTYKPPLPSHHWVEGLWLYWAMTGDESVHDSAQEASDVLLSHPMENYAYGVDYNESRWVGWPIYGLVAAWRYTGRISYLEQAKRLINMLVQAEENAGRKGYFIPAGTGIGNRIQPFMWSGYSQIGTIEYWRETGDKRVSDFLVRVADWLIGSKGQLPALKGGRLLPNGKYEPLGTSPFWAPGQETPEPRQTELGIMSLPLLTFAARSTGREEFRDKARLLFRDINYFRDTAEGATILPTELSILNFRSLQFAGSYVKAYGHFGLFAPDFLADYVSGQKRE